MKIDNPVQMNDWKIKKFLITVLAIQIALWGLISLDIMGLQIPIIRELIGLIYLAFIPGILILRIIKLHNLGNIESLLYAVALSLTTVMFTGFFTNMTYPLIGISRPISIIPLTITMGIIILVLCILCYIRDKDFFSPSFINIQEILSTQVLSLCLIPFLAIFGTYLMNYYQNNVILMLLIIIIAIIPILIGFDIFFPKNLYPLAVFIIAISLLYHKSLISMHVYGADAQHEYYLANLVLKYSQWEPAIQYQTNAMLSIVMLSPIFSTITDISLVWMFKIIYPLLFSLVPLVLYRVFQRLNDDKSAFLSCFFFISLFTFYDEMLSLARQQIAELFLALLILLMIDKGMNKVKRSFLLIIFGISLAVSHYGISYIYMFSLILSLAILEVMDNPIVNKLRYALHFRFNTFKKSSSEEVIGHVIIPNREKYNIRYTFVILFTTFTLAWYIYISGSYTFNSIVHIVDLISSSIWTDLFNPWNSQPLEILLAKPISPFYAITKYLHLTSQIFILLGFIILFLKQEKFGFGKEYTAFSLVNLVIWFVSIISSYFARTINTSRLYQITLIFLAPFCIIGGITVFKAVTRAIGIPQIDIKSSFKILSVFLSILLLFNSQFVFVVVKDRTTSISLNSRYDSVRFNDREVFAANWWYRTKVDQVVYADRYRSFLLGRFEWEQARPITMDAGKIPENSYLYLGTINIIEEKRVYINYLGLSRVIEYTSLDNLTQNRSKIYDNGGAQIYGSRINARNWKVKDK